MWFLFIAGYAQVSYIWPQSGNSWPLFCQCGLIHPAHHVWIMDYYDTASNLHYRPIGCIFFHKQAAPCLIFRRVCLAWIWNIVEFEFVIIFPNIDLVEWINWTALSKRPRALHLTPRPLHFMAKCMFNLFTIRSVLHIPQRMYKLTLDRNTL